jgi:phosphoribosylaminoimidazolecarboxamide formyltransferase/IMP cyclohydrolase
VIEPTATPNLATPDSIDPVGRIPIRRALVSVYDKTGLDQLAKVFMAAQVEVVSTGSTAQKLRDLGVTVTEVSDLTGFPESFDGRVKTLHPMVHAGLLADRRLASHLKQLDDLGIKPFDLVVSNLYPFTETVASGASVDECIEQIDIGGPSMVRAAAKNHPSVAIVTSPDDYNTLVAAIDAGGFTLHQRQGLAARAFALTAEYDQAVSTWMASVFADQLAELGALSSAEPDVEAATSETVESALPGEITIRATKLSDLRYGENSHQPASLYVTAGETGLAQAEQLGGKAMSYNNYTDTDAAYRAVYDFAEPAVAIIKHANPCGIAVGADIADAHLKAHACDPVSAFGGVVATNRPVSQAMAENLKPIFTEVIVAPSYEPGALEVLHTKKNLRILVAEPYPARPWEYRQITGGVLAQTPDQIDATGDDCQTWQLKAGPGLDEAGMQDLVFAWRACRSVKSNAILLAHDLASVGVGMGQVNRVDSCRLAVERAGDRAASSVAASDAFFPFADGPGILIEAGVRAIVEPGGSIRDEETIQACQAAGVSLYFTGVRHFFH